MELDRHAGEPTSTPFVIFSLCVPQCIPNYPQPIFYLGDIACFHAPSQARVPLLGLRKKKSCLSNLEFRKFTKVVIGQEAAPVSGKRMHD